jgi:hypothetical protein
LISFRYHIISLTAVFLAIGLGFVLGSAIQPTDRATRGSISRLTRELNSTRAQIGDLRNQVQGSSSLVKNLSTRVTRGALAGRQVLFVDDGASSSWEGGVRRAMSEATATDVGTLTLTDKWTNPNANADLVAIAAPAGVKVGSEGAGSAVMSALGERFGKPEGAQLTSSLVKAGYVAVSAKVSEQWPPPATAVVAFTSGTTTPQSGALSAFARAAGKTTPVAVIAGGLDNLGAVGSLRASGGLPQYLVTFDSGSSDPNGIGPVLALGAAIDGHAGNFGNGPGLSYVPPV